ncbi:MAG TPA: DNA-3-methyladenine glycosylase I [Acidimicrobiales bacterium]|nr:DNA-3-methyladenine glycosylase I [Acidimicrobiales bacterium]
MSVIPPPDVIVGDDGHPRCRWGAADADPLYRAYHDNEWGRPLRDEVPLFELLCLEAFQSGLSWITILRKREAFRRAFDAFDPKAVAAYEEPDVSRLLADESIIRNRSKIEATITNAQAVETLHAEGTTLVEAVFAHTPPRSRRPKTFADIPSKTDESKALSKSLRDKGFKFVGPTVAYALMQSAGVVDDHVEGCWIDISEPRPDPPSG